MPICIVGEDVLINREVRMQVQKIGGSTFPVGSLRRANRELQKILEKLSTAQRINRASDDAAGLAVSEQLRSNIRGFKVASQNINDAMSALNITDGAANESTAILQRQRELAMQSRNDTLTDKDRTALDTEYQQLTKELDRIAGVTKFNTQDVTSGQGLASGNAVIQSGSEAGDQMNMPKVDIKSISLGVQPTSIATSAGASQAVGTLDNALGSINSQRSTVGAAINRLESSVNNLSVAMVNTQAAESVLRDEDMAQGLAELTQARLLQDGSIAAFARFNEINKSYVKSLIG
jgi:flagellin